MSFLDTLHRERGFLAAEAGATPGPGSDFWYEPAGGDNSAGMRITPETVTGIDSAYASNRVLSETLAQLPVGIFQRRKGGGRDEASDHPLLPVLRNPNDEDTSFSFRETAQWDLGFRGNHYSEIFMGRRGVERLVPLHPDTVNVQRLTNGRRRYDVTRPDGTVDKLPPEKIFHIPAMKVDRKRAVGLNPIAYHRTTLGIAAAQNAYAAGFYKNNAQPSVALFNPNWGDAEARAGHLAAWKRAHGGPNRSGVAFMPDSTTIEIIKMSHRDAQHIDGMKLSAYAVARIFRMQPHMIGLLDRATFSNIEEQSRAFVIYTILSWVIRWESEINRQLLVMADTHFVKFNLDSLLRGTIADRYQAHMTAIQAGWKTRNEVREDEDLNPIEGLGEVLTPVNMERGSGRDGDAKQEARVARLEKQVDTVLTQFKNMTFAGVNGDGDHEFEDI